MTPIRVLIADDHTLVRAGFRALINNIAGFTVVAEARNGREALHEVATNQPDVVLMDIAMSELNGLEATLQIKQEFPVVRVIILSMHSNEEYVLQALRVGAMGYLLKDSSVAELELAIAAVMRDETYLSPAVSKHLVEYVQRVDHETSSLDRLTVRQREVLQLIAEGHTNQEIAQILHISIKTVETHRSQLMDRLDIHDVAGLVRYAIRMGVVTSNE